MVVELPYTAAEFNEVKENFKRGVAAAVGADATIVKINKVSAASARRVMLSSRKLLSSGVDVDFSVIVPDGLDADTMANELTIENLNTNLNQQGIREVSAVKSAPTVSQTSEEKSGSKNNQMIIYAVVPAAVVILAIAAYMFYRKRKAANSKDQTPTAIATPNPIVIGTVGMTTTVQLDTDAETGISRIPAPAIQGWQPQMQQPQPPPSLYPSHLSPNKGVQARGAEESAAPSAPSLRAESTRYGPMDEVQTPTAPPDDGDVHAAGVQVMGLKLW